MKLSDDHRPLCRLERAGEAVRTTGKRQFVLDWRSRAFTLLEVMLAIMMFGLVLSAIYTIWLAIMKGTKASQDAADAVQRSRITMRALEDALLTAQLFNANIGYYSFVADNQSMSMVSRLPASFPGVGRYGDQVVRRVSFYLEAGSDGMDQLVMTQAPLLMDLRSGEVEPYTIVLAKGVSVFDLQYWDMQKQDWVEEWVQTNSMPKLVQVILGLGKTPGSASRAQDVSARIVPLPGSAVALDLQMPFGPGMPGFGPGMTNRFGRGMIPGQQGYPPANYPAGGYPPGGFPGGYPGGYPPVNRPFR